MTWIVNVGKKINGKTDLRRFRTQEDAERFQKEWNLKLAENNTPDLADLQRMGYLHVLRSPAWYRGRNQEIQNRV